jgi:ABC-type multidrug transport system ATPase subunit
MEGLRITVPSNPFYVGRTKDANQLVLDDTEISRCHAIITYLDGKWSIEDRSANGTYINDQRIKTAALQPGSIVRFGLSGVNQFLFEQSDAATRRPAGPSHAAPNGQALQMGVQRTVFEKVDAAPVFSARLQLVIDRFTVQDIVLPEGETLMGRTEAANKIFIDHLSISADHAKIVLNRNGNAALIDLRSSNGTFVNEERISERVLQEGDLIRLGTCQTHLLLFRATHPRVETLQDFDLSSPIVKLGRDPGNKVVLNHPTVSSFHAEIRTEGETVELIDLNSTNGTFVNGVRIKRQKLQLRDRVAIGAVQLSFTGSFLEQQADGKTMTLFATGLTKEVPDSKTGEPLRLLDEISLVFKPYEFIGLLGPSGSGKSTLMDALNGFRPADSGDVFLNDRNLYRYLAELRSAIGYLPQDDTLHRTLTVRECLTYSAKLRLPADFSDTEIARRVQDVIDTLHLTERADKSVKLLSGGQRKRVSLGLELLSKPSVLFVDEPTAGQDPKNEQRLMQLFRSIANQGTTVLINTHLLGSFNLLDKVAVLVRGNLVFFGPGDELLRYFKCSHVEEIYDVLEGQTPAELRKRFRASPLYEKYVRKELEAGGHLRTEQDDGRSAARPVRRAVQKKQPVMHQLKVLLARQFKLRLGDKGNAMTLLLPPLLIALLTLFVGDMKNNPMILFMVVLVALWFGCASCVREIVDERDIYKRERQRDLQISSYLGSKLGYLVVVAGLQSLVFVGALMILPGILNGIPGLNVFGLSGHFAAAFAISWFMGVQGGLIGLLISALAPNAERALYIFPLTMMPQLLLAGLLVPVGSFQPFFVDANTFTRIDVQGKLPSLNAELYKKGMPDALRYTLSPLMVSRWGTEALADLYIHDYQSQPEDKPAYSIELLDSMTTTFHPNDLQKAQDFLENARTKGLKWVRDYPKTPSTLPIYMAILSAFAAVMVASIWFGLVRGEK